MPPITISSELSQQDILTLTIRTKPKYPDSTVPKLYYGFVDMSVTPLNPETLGSEMVTITVGQAPFQRDFSLHKKLLCIRSDFFSKAFNNGRFIESQENKMNLAHDDPEAFAIFVDYIYRGIILPNDQHSAQDNREAYYMTTQKVYVLADKLCMIHLMNSAMDNLRENIGWWDITKRMDSVHYVYDNTRQGSPLRKLVACDAAWRLKRASSPLVVGAILDTTKEVAVFPSDILWAQQNYGKVLDEGRWFGSCPFRRGKNVGDCDFHVPAPGKQCCDGTVLKAEH